MTDLNKAVTRRTRANVPHGVKPEIVVTLYPGGTIGLRESGRRRTAEYFSGPREALCPRRGKRSCFQTNGKREETRAGAQTKETIKMNLGRCPNCDGPLRFYDGCLGYEGARCDLCGYERDLNAEANAKATAEREASESSVRCPDHRNGGATRCPRGGAALQIWQRKQWGE